MLSTSVCWLTPNYVEGNFDFVKKEPSRTKTLVLQPFRLHLHTNLSLRLALTLKRIAVLHCWHVSSITTSSVSKPKRTARSSPWRDMMEVRFFRKALSTTACLTKLFDPFYNGLLDISHRTKIQNTRFQTII